MSLKRLSQVFFKDHTMRYCLEQMIIRFDIRLRTMIGVDVFGRLSSLNLVLVYEVRTAVLSRSFCPDKALGMGRWS